MPNKKPPESMSEFLDGLVDLFTDLPERTTQELEEDLREEGIDTEAFVQRVQMLVESKLQEQRLAWLEHARQGRTADLEKLRRVQPSKALDKIEEVKQKIKDVLTGQFGSGALEYANAQLHHRNLNNVTENDLRSLLDDLERLELLTQSSDTNKTKDE